MTLDVDDEEQGEAAQKVSNSTTAQSAPSDIPMDKLAKVYRRMQEKIQQLTTEYDTALAAIKGQQDAVKNALKDQMLKMGVNSVRTDAGTVTLSTRTKYSTQDWDAFKEFIKEHDAIDLLEKRIAQTNMGLYLKDNPGVVPPGLNSMSEYAISVRKPVAK